MCNSLAMPVFLYRLLIFHHRVMIPCCIKAKRDVLTLGMRLVDDASMGCVAGTSPCKPSMTGSEMSGC